MCITDLMYSVNASLNHPHTHTPLHHHLTPHTHTATVSAINAYSVKLTAQIIAVVTVLKLFAVSFIALLGLASLISRRSFPEEAQHLFKSREGFELTASSLALAFYGVMWSYDGW